MKFRKIEIQAFRAYRNFQDGTFDFVVPTGETADFISIYAPNGFGKTSFYDAVEWGMTNNISRMLRREKENLQDAKAVNEHDIIRNKNAAQKDNTFVRLYTDTAEKPIENKLKLGRGARKDFSFRKKDTFPGKEYFQEVILSQEWIDAFLKEDDAEKRYEKFMQAFGDENIYRQYNIYSSLIKLNESKIKELDSQLKNLQTQLNFDFDADILTKINTEITAANQKGETLPTVDTNSTEKHMLQLANSLSDRITDLNSEIETLQQNLDKLENLQLGREATGIDLYWDSKIKSEKLKLQLEELDKIKKIFIQLRESENKLKTKAENTEQIRKRQKDTNSLIAAYPQYQIIAEQIKQYNTSVSQNETLLNKYNEENTTLTEACNILNIQIDGEREKIEYAQKHLNEIPLLKADLTEKSKEKKSILEQIDVSNSEKKELDELLTDIEKRIIIFDYCIARLKEDDFYSILKEKTGFYEEILNELIDRNKKIEQIILTKNTLDKEIQSITTLTSNIEQLVTQGTTIINEQKLSVCPLCKHEYDSYASLLKQVQNNAFLSDKMKSLLLEKESKESILKELLKQQKNQKNQLLECFKTEVKSLQEKQKHELLHRSQIELKIVQHQKAIQNLEKYISNLVKDLGGEQTEKAEKELLETIANSNKLHIELKKEYVVAEKKAKDKAQEIRILQEKSNILKKEITRLKSDLSYTQIVTYIENNAPEVTKIEKILEEQNFLLNNELQTAVKEISELEKKIIEYKSLLEKYEEKQVDNEIEKIGKDCIITKKNIHAFEHFTLSFLNYDSSHKEKEEITDFLKTNYNSYKNNIERKEDLAKSLKKIREYKDNVLPYLKHEQLTNEHSYILKEKKFLKDKVGKRLEEERKKLSEYINVQAESFFHNKLINLLYRKIDPHPKYKEIKFSCEFKDKPRLNILVKDDSLQDSLVPTLYFSTAQLNILSLCIFLARALNVKDDSGKPVDCIFIDDPIQAMDSINILSTIDLLRGIVINLEKQIILSTHDENFQNLLKKKIPQELFKSKFLELETFGKVRIS